MIFSYLRPAIEGDTIVIDAQAMKTGKRLSYLQCEVRNKQTGELIAKGIQTQVSGEQPLAENNDDGAN